jgi:RND family efflux transporter MFP subunit
VSLVPAAMVERAAREEAGGIVQARTSATVMSRLMAPVREVRVVAGQRVRAGQVLIVLDARDLTANARRARAAVEAAEQGTRAARSEQDAAGAALALSRATHERISTLHGRKSATAQELDDVTAALRGAEARATGAAARIAEADATLTSTRAAAEAAAVTASYAVVTAPFDGLVTEKLIEPGNMAAPGTPLLRLDASDGFRVDVRIDESRAGLLAPGQPATIALDEPGGSGERLLRGTVSEVARAVDADARAVLVKVAVDEAAGLRSGMFARVRFAGPSRRVLTVPAAAIVRRGQVASVFVADGDIARLRLIQAGTTSDDRTEILAGLDAGEMVVASPPAGLTDGQPLRGGATPTGSTGAGR